MLLYLERNLFLVPNKNKREGSNAQLLMFWRFKSGISWQSYSSNIIYCFRVPILNASVYFYSKEFSRKKNRSASLLKVKVFITPVGKSEVQEKHQFPPMLYNHLLYIICYVLALHCLFTSDREHSEHSFYISLAK